MRAIRLVYPMMKAQKWGRIVNTIGGAGKEPDPYMFGSGMTNSALLNSPSRSRPSWRGQCAGERRSARAGSTPTCGSATPKACSRSWASKSEDEARRLAARKNSLNRFGKPEELANAIVFLCSERASYITGVSLNLDGGRLKGAVVDHAGSGIAAPSGRGSRHCTTAKAPRAAA